MRKIIYLIILGLLLSLVGCSANQNQIIMTKTDNNVPISSQSELPSSPPDDNMPSNTSDDSTPIPADDPIKQITLNVNDQELSFYFSMTIDEAISLLDTADISYKQTDDTSPFRSWSGICFITPSFKLVFDLRGLLHEIIITKKIESNLPIMVDDLVVDMYTKLGEAPSNMTPDAFGATGLLYSDYEYSNYFLKATYFEERIPVEEYTIFEVIVSKYDLNEYSSNLSPATLIFTNKAGAEADFFIGMSVDDVKAQLEALGLHYMINNGVLSGDSYDIIPENDTPDGYDFCFYFDSNHGVCTVETYGPGVLTQLGLQAGDPEEKMLELYGDGYIKTKFDNDYWNQYRYVSGNNYLNISTSTELDFSAPVNVLEITRYTDMKLKQGVDYGIE